MAQPDPHASPISGVAPPVATRWKPGQSGGGRGFPKGFIPLSQAYAIIGAKFEPSEVEQIARGEKPKSWGKRPLLMPYVTAAKMWLAGTPPASAEIADRTEGKVKQTTDLNVSAPDLATFFARIAGEK